MVSLMVCLFVCFYKIFIISLAPYNATGNETCPYYYDIDECEFDYSRYFSESKTVLFFIRNDVSETVNQVTINIYEGEFNFFWKFLVLVQF